MVQNKDFELFQSEFKKWQKLLGLTNYKVYFKYEELEETFASISVNLKDMVATVCLNSILPDKDKAHKDIMGSARHEAIHLLLSKLEREASSRFTLEEDIYEEVEGIVHRLEELL